MLSDHRLTIILIDSLLIKSCILINHVFVWSVKEPIQCSVFLSSSAFSVIFLFCSSLFQKEIPLCFQRYYDFNSHIFVFNFKDSIFIHLNVELVQFSPSNIQLLLVTSNQAFDYAVRI